jgi:putative flavoprotein involved in K+ transport
MSSAEAKVLARWATAFESAVKIGSARQLTGLFQVDAWWRDLLAATWDIRTARGDEEIAARLAGLPDDMRPVRAAIQDGAIPDKVEAGGDGDFLQALFTFETEIAYCQGIVRLKPDPHGPDGWSGWTLLTAMTSLKDHPEAQGGNRPRGGRGDRRSAVGGRGQAATVEPEVVVIGAGQAGLSIAARLKLLGTESVLIERNGRVGDNWRNRYPSLILHDPVWYNGMPCVPFPPSWPIFTARDKFADWLESFPRTMDLEVWNGTEVVEASYDVDRGRWQLTVRRQDGEEQALSPRDVVLATGISGEPNPISFPGLDEFRGQVWHSSEYPGADQVKGRKSVVVGAGTSGHDIAQDLCEHGRHTTLIQRGSTYVFSMEANLLLMKGLYEEGGPPPDLADLLASSFSPVLAGQVVAPRIAEIAGGLDRDLLVGLERAGFKTDLGVDEAGPLLTFLTRGGGYYIDVGCSGLIADGQIEVRSGSGLRRFTETGIELEDGSILDADAVILATGFGDMRETARKIFGSEVIDRCGPIWGLDSEGELQGVYRASGHPALWFMGGHLQFCRIFSRYLALRIKGKQAGLQTSQAHGLSGALSG